MKQSSRAPRLSLWTWTTVATFLLFVVSRVSGGDDPCTLTLQSGSLNGRKLPTNDPEITVTPGELITGSVSLRVLNTMSANAIAPLAATPTWGDPARTYWEIQQWVKTGSSTQNAEVTLKAPPEPGTYYIVFALAGTYNVEQIMSGTHPGWQADWKKGNRVASQPASLFEDAIKRGTVPFEWYSPEGPKHGNMAMAAIRVIVGNNSLKESKPVKFVTSPGVSAAPMPEIGTRWAVIIGISSYKDSRISGLRYAAADAKAFHEWAVSPSGGRYAPANVKILLNEQATGEKIKDALFHWLKQALAEDVVTIYFACHGSPESPDSNDNLFILPFDADYERIATTGFPMWDIETALKRFVKARKVVVIADACHSGGVGQSFDIARRDNRGIKVNSISSGIQDLSKVSDGVCVISASDASQLSQESEAWGGGHGVFTHYLLQGLNGEADYNKDKQVTLGEIIPYLSEQVRRATKSAQSPTVAGKFDPALSIGK